MKLATNLLINQMTIPRISVVIPIHDMPNADYFLGRVQNSLEEQSLEDFEIIVANNGTGMANNTNAGIKDARGELVKILFMDDYLAHYNSLKEISENFTETDEWLVTGCVHTENDETFFNPHFPAYTDGISQGINTIGSPSVLTFRNHFEDNILFDEQMTWVLDCDLYRRMFDKYGLPKVLNTLNVVIGVGTHQTTHILKEDYKAQETNYLIEKYK